MGHTACVGLPARSSCLAAQGVVVAAAARRGQAGGLLRGPCRGRGKVMDVCWGWGDQQGRWTTRPCAPPPPPRVQVPLLPTLPSCRAAAGWGLCTGPPAGLPCCPAADGGLWGRARLVCARSNQPWTVVAVSRLGAGLRVDCAPFRPLFHDRIHVCTHIRANKGKHAYTHMHAYAGTHTYTHTHACTHTHMSHPRRCSTPSRCWGQGGWARSPPPRRPPACCGAGRAGWRGARWAACCTRPEPMHARCWSCRTRLLGRRYPTHAQVRVWGGGCDFSPAIASLGCVPRCALWLRACGALRSSVIPVALHWCSHTLNRRTRTRERAHTHVHAHTRTHIHTNARTHTHPFPTQTAHAPPAAAAWMRPSAGGRPSPPHPHPGQMWWATARFQRWGKLQGLEWQHRCCLHVCERSSRAWKESRVPKEGGGPNGRSWMGIKAHTLYGPLSLIPSRVLLPVRRTS